MGRYEFTSQSYFTKENKNKENFYRIIDINSKVTNLGDQNLLIPDLVCIPRPYIWAKKLS